MNAFNCNRPRMRHAMALAIATAFVTLPALAQQMDHSKMHHPPPEPEPAKTKPKPKPKKKAAPAPAAKPADPHAGHSMPAPAAPVDHSTMDHSTMDHSTMDHGSPAAPGQPRTPIPVLTPEDRLAAFPEVSGHAAHDRSRHSYWLADRLEAGQGHGDTVLDWKASGWVGGDINRLWLRSEGAGVDGRVERGDLEVLGGHAISPWWDLVAGVRHDFGEGPSQTFAAVGVTGLAPYKIELEATAYLGTSGQTAARIEASYDTLLTNRLILQWHAEADLYGKDDESRGIGAGLATLEGGVRLRYEVTRQFAPYVGLTWERAFGGTADLRREHLEDVGDTRLVAGVRVWF
jgi:copper resistance protein B